MSQKRKKYVSKQFTFQPFNEMKRKFDLSLKSNQKGVEEGSDEISASPSARMSPFEKLNFEDEDIPFDSPAPKKRLKLNDSMDEIWDRMDWLVDCLSPLEIHKEIVDKDEEVIESSDEVISVKLQKLTLTRKRRMTIKQRQAKMINMISMIHLSLILFHTD